MRRKINKKKQKFHFFFSIIFPKFIIICLLISYAICCFLNLLLTCTAAAPLFRLLALTVGLANIWIISEANRKRGRNYQIELFQFKSSTPASWFSSPVLSFQVKASNKNSHSGDIRGWTSRPGSGPGSGRVSSATKPSIWGTYFNFCWINIWERQIKERLISSFTGGEGMSRSFRFRALLAAHTSRHPGHAALPHLIPWPPLRHFK